MTYKLVIQFPLDEAEAVDFDRMITIENELGIALGASHRISGHDLGEIEMSIIILTDDPHEAFTLAKTIFSDDDLKTISATSKDTESEEDIVIWPERVIH